jgi:hypothetical protein
MRPTIKSAKPPITVETYDELRTLHAKFMEVFTRHVPPPHADRLATQAKRLSEVYNQLAPGRPYGRPELADARLHFFMPTDIVKLWGPLLELMATLPLANRKQLSILDLGGGTGTGCVSAALVLAALGFEGRVEFTVVEPDNAVNRHLKKTFEVLQECKFVTFETKVEKLTIEDYLARKSSARRNDLVLIVNVLSEAFPEDEYAAGAARWFKQIVRELTKKSGFLLVIEPALRRFSRLLSEAGDKCRGDGLPLLAPCRPGSCPHLVKGERFCFHSMRAPLTPLLQSVSARSNLDRHEVNFAYLTFGHGEEPLTLPEPGPGEVLGRTVSFPRRVKKGFNYHVCTAEGILVAFAPRILPDGATKGGKLPIGTIVTVAS